MAEQQAAARLTIALLLEEEKNQRGKTRKWMKKRKEKGFYTKIIHELRIEDTEAYKEMMRMTHEGFLEILRYIEPYISPQESVRGTKIITASERLALTIRFLATGELFSSLTYQF